MDSLIKNDQKFRFWHFFPPISLIEPVMGPSIKDARTLRGGGEGERGQAKVDKCGEGEGVVSQTWTSAWKKIIATIFVKFTQIIW